MTLEPGRNLGHYRIVGPLGAGGMGEVYRATDTRLGRDVAVKSLPADLATEPARLARFRREAQLLAALNHPHIAAIHGLEEIDGRPFLILELVEGETLAARLERGPIAVLEALDLATQIADGLEEAHEKGIVHRDLKPANVAVTAAGKVKILDFGLAKAYEDESVGGGSGSDLSQSPTLTGIAGTRAGVILGTAAYMSPEQARGRPVDKRSDIWAFGVVLFEMLTGRATFAGETVSDILAAVLTRDPSFDALPASAPPALRRLLARCLVRDPKRRLRDIGEARIALVEIAAGEGGSDAAADTAAPAPASEIRPVLLAAGAVVLGAIALYAGFAFGSRHGAPATSASRTIRFAVPAPAEVDTIRQPAVAPDGSFVVYEGHSGGKSALYLHRFDTMTTSRIEGSEDGARPFVSWDGRWIGFSRGLEIRKVALSGGESLLVQKTPGSYPGATWGPEGTILIARSWLSGLSIVSANGGEARTLTTPDSARGEKGHWWPHFLPDGRHALFTIWRAGSGLNDCSVALVDRTSGTYQALFPGADAWYQPPGRIVYYRAGAYHAIPFDAASLKVTGEPVPLLKDVPVLNPSGDDNMVLGVGADGTVVYGTSDPSLPARLAWVAPNQKPTMLPVPARRYIDADLSPDGGTLAASSIEGGQFEIHLIDLRAGTEQRLDLPGSNWTARWSPRGLRLAYRSMRKGDFDAYLTDISAGGAEVPLLTGESDTTIQSWTPDGHLLYLDTVENGRGIKMMTVPPQGDPVAFDDWRVEGSNLAVSPDGKWAVYQSAQSGASEIYARPLPGPGPATRLTRDGGEAPAFARDGGLFILRKDAIVREPYTVDSGRLIPQGGMTILEAPLATGNRWLRTLDGRRFLVPLRLSDPPRPELQVLINAPAAAPVTPSDDRR